jgi:uncharacterized protein DUF6984
MYRGEGFRTPRPMEVDLPKRLLAADFPGAHELREQLVTAKVRSADDDGCLEFLIIGGPPAPVTQRVPVEGEAIDQDGVGIHCLLFVTNGVMSRLEFYKDDNSEIRKRPDVEGWEVVALPPPPGLGDRGR